MKHFEIPASHIFYSRDATFLPGIMTATNGTGVDLVLNSLSGELLHASWQCVAEFGEMVEIGKRDIIGKATLRLDLFAGNRSFLGVDMTGLPLEKVHTYVFFWLPFLQPLWK